MNIALWCAESRRAAFKQIGLVQHRPTPTPTTSDLDRMQDLREDIMHKIRGWGGGDHIFIPSVPFPVSPRSCITMGQRESEMKVLL